MEAKSFLRCRNLFKCRSGDSACGSGGGGGGVGGGGGIGSVGGGGDALSPLNCWSEFLSADKRAPGELCWVKSSREQEESQGGNIRSSAPLFSSIC